MARSPGRDALAEAARLELARIYGTTLTEYTPDAIDELATRRARRRTYDADRWQRRKREA